MGVELIQDPRLKGALALPLYELALVLPMLVILAWRRAPLSALGFRPFTANAFAVGCGLLIITYMATVIHNTALMMLGAPTQFASVLQLLTMFDSPWGFAIGAAIVAPLIEEMVYRGFFFQRLREAYGSARAILFSSLAFSASHLQLEVIIPTFLLGAALAYVYERSDSLWPGVLLHLLENLLGVCIVLAITRFPNAL